MDFNYGGRVRNLRPEDSFKLGEIGGKVPLVICDPDVGPVLAYFDPARRPRVGMRVGAVGHWIRMSGSATTENSPPGFPVCSSLNWVQIQLDVLAWQRLSANYDWVLERSA